jgi:tellurite resistance protein
MANVKITDLTELAAVDLATNDVLPIVDINNDSTKKVTIATLTGLSDANDFVTYTQLNSNIDVVSGNVDAVEANVASIVDTGGHTVTFSGNVIPSADGVYDLGSASAKWKDLHLTGASIKLGGITISDLGNEGISITGASGEQANVVTPQLGGAANVSANIATLEANVASTDTRLGANITLLTDEDTALQSRLATNVTTFTNEDTALQARIAANTLVAASNDFITFTRLQANIDLVQDNVAAISVTLGVRGDGGTNDDVTVGTEELVFLGDTGITTTVSSNTVTIDLDDTAVSPGLYGGVSGGVTNVAAVTIDATGRITNASNVSVVTNLDTLQDNINVLDGNADAIAADVTALETRRAANVTLSDAEDTAIQSRLTTNVTLFLNEDTALQSRLATNVTTFTNEDTALQARIAANTLVAAANDFVTFTRLQANIDLVQDNVTTASGGADGVEARRVANIAGAVSTITTADLTASRAVVSDGSGKIAVSAVTATELGYLDGVSSAIQTQLDAKAALAGATFTGEVTMSDDLIVTGNLTINGDTTTVSTTNLDVEDRIIMLADGVTGSPSADVGLLFNRGNQGNAAFFYDESGKTFKLSDTKDPKSNTSLSPVTASNLSVGIVDAATLKYDGLSVHTSIADNASVAAAASAAVEARRVANIAGAVSTITTGNLTASRALASDGSGKVVVSAVTATELGYLDGVSSAIQTQLNSKQATITGAATTIDDADLTASRALASDGSGKVAVSAVTATELGYLDGVSSAIQTQLDAKLASTSYTASDVLTKLLTVDGTGSSLDADQLDGQHGNYYAVETTRASNAAELASGIASAVAGSGITSFSFEDDDSTSVEMGDGQRIKFIEGGGVDINFTDVSPGSVADPYDLTFTVTSSVIAGAGLTGGGVLSADRTLNIGAGTGVTVNANDIAIGQDVGTGDSPTFAGLTVTTFDLGALS